MNYKCLGENAKVSFSIFLNQDISWLSCTHLIAIVLVLVTLLHRHDFESACEFDVILLVSLCLKYSMYISILFSRYLVV